MNWPTALVAATSICCLSCVAVVYSGVFIAKVNRSKDGEKKEPPEPDGFVDHHRY